MGDLFSGVVSGRLYHIPQEEFARINALQIPPESRAEIFSDMIRLNALYMISCAGSGHIGSSFSAADIITWLHLNELQGIGQEGGDIYFSSKGHDVPAFYSMLLARGMIDFNMIHKLRRLDGLPGHPDISTNGIPFNTGSLGMGFSKAKGLIAADRLLGRSRRVFVLTGDGELQEGQNWEALAGAVHACMGELTVIVDHNKFQSDMLVEETSSLGDLEAKFKAFGWQVARCDGHDFSALSSVFRGFSEISDRPKILIADTIKGCGVSFMEHTAMPSGQELYGFHSGAPSVADYGRGVSELLKRINANLGKVDASSVEVEWVDLQPAKVSSDTQRLMPAYSQALIEAAEDDPKVVALDADLMLDMGLIEFRKKFPSRYFECGIAEQDMVSMAGGMARFGLLPVTNSFSCFLSTRPNEQIYNNASEGSKVIYVGALAGLVPGAPGHSHQAIRDISALSAVPGLVMIEPCCEGEVKLAVRWATKISEDSCYMRLISVPWPVNWSLPAGYEFSEGRGCVIADGEDAVIITYGIVMLGEALEASHLLAQKNIGLRVVNLPWLNRVDSVWLQNVVGGRPVFTLDNHYINGGQGEMIASRLAEIGGVVIARFGLDRLPECGTNDEVLRAHGLDGEGLASRIAEGLGQA